MSEQENQEKKETLDIMGQAETDSAQPPSKAPAYEPADADEIQILGIHPAQSEVSDDPNSVPASAVSVTEVAALADAVAKVEQATKQIEETASQIQVAQEAATKVSESADQLHEAVQKITATADQIQVVQKAQTATTETPAPLTAEEIETIVDKKVEEAITASTTTPAEPEKELAPTATPITVETAQAIGTAVAAALTAVSTETPTVQAENCESAVPTEILTAKISAPESISTSNGNSHAVKQLSKTNLFLTTVIVVLSITFGFYGLYQGNHPQLPPAAKPEPAQITPMGPVALPFISDTPEESPDDYNLIIQKQVNLLKARPVKLKLGKILAESEIVAQTIQGNIDQLKRKGSTDAQAVVKSFLFENVVDAILGELPEDQKSTEGIRDMIKAELEKVSKYAEANFPEQP